MTPSPSLRFRICLHRTGLLPTLFLAGAACFTTSRGIAAELPRAQSIPSTQQRHTFAVEADHFVLDGKPFKVISGELHYARIPREYWHARLQMARAMGLNTVATYVFWNVHEPSPGRYDFSGNADLRGFLLAAQEEGLFVILRAGPYACAEWDLGGLPAWLLKDPGAHDATLSPSASSPNQHPRHLDRTRKCRHLDRSGAERRDPRICPRPTPRPFLRPPPLHLSTSQNAVISTEASGVQTPLYLQMLGAPPSHHPPSAPPTHASSSQPIAGSIASGRRSPPSRSATAAPSS